MKHPLAILAAAAAAISGGGLLHGIKQLPFFAGSRSGKYRSPVTPGAFGRHSVGMRFDRDNRSVVEFAASRRANKNAERVRKAMTINVTEGVLDSSFNRVSGKRRSTRHA